MSGQPAAPTLGEQLDGICGRLDAATEAWVAADYPYEGPTYQAREAAYAELRAWTQRVEATAAARVRSGWKA